MTLIKILDSNLPLKLEWLRSFLAVAELGNYSEAARSLRLSQPAVWTHVRELEENLRARLFENFARRPRLSRVGELAAREARRVIESVHAFRDEVTGAASTVRGIVAVAASTTPGNYLLPAVMREFERRHPGARTTLSIGNSERVLRRVAESEADVGIAGLRPDSTDFVSRPLCRDDIVLFAGKGHRLAGRRATARDLRGERFIVREPASATRRLSESFLAAGTPRPLLMELGCPETVKRAVAAGLGIGLLSRIAIRSELRRGELVEVRARGVPIRRELTVVLHRRKHVTPALEAFLGILEKRVGGRRRS